jgi:hypothetical protein
MLWSVYVRPPVASFLVYDLHRCAVSRHAAPKGAFPRPPARGLPPRRACARFTSPRQPSRCNTEPLLQSPKLPTQRLCESQAAKPLPNQSHARRADATGTRSCAASPGTLSPAWSKATGKLPFSFRRRDFTYTVQGLLVRSSLRSTLSRSGLISLGFSKKYSGGYEAFCLVACAISMSSTIEMMRRC